MLIRYGDTVGWWYRWYGTVVRQGWWYGAVVPRFRAGLLQYIRIYDGRTTAYTSRARWVWYGGTRAWWYEGSVAWEDGFMKARWHGGTVVRWYVRMVVHESTMDRGTGIRMGRTARIAWTGLAALLVVQVGVWFISAAVTLKRYHSHGC